MKNIMNILERLISQPRTAQPAAGLILAAALLATVAHAADSPKLVVVKPDNDEQTICVFDESDRVNVNNNSGDVRVHCSPSLPESTQIVASFSLSPAEAHIGEPVHVSWSSDGPPGYQCTKTNSSSAIGSWANGSSVSHDGSQTLSTSDANPGPYTLGIKCSLPNSDLDAAYSSADVELVDNQGPQPDPEITSFTATVTKSAPSGRIKLEWSTVNATSCQASGDWSGSQSTGTGRSRTITNLSADSYTFELTCSNNSENPPAVATVQATVTTESVGDIEPACETRRELPGSFKQTHAFAYHGAGSTFADIWGNFPGNNTTHNVRLSRNEYAALAFNSGPDPGIKPDGDPRQWGIGYEASKGGGGVYYPFGAVVWAISRCPGDFDKDAIAEDEYTQGLRCHIRGVNALKAEMDGPNNTRAVCRLKPNTQYYLNITTVSGATNPNGNPGDYDWSCADPSRDECGAMMSPYGSWLTSPELD